MATIKNVSKTPIIAIKEARRFVKDCLTTVGAPKKVAKNQAKLLVDADTTGHFSHGMNRLEFYVHDIQKGLCDPKGMPEILNENYSTAWVDGHNGMGATSGIFCMKLAIKKAKKTGVGWVASKNCNHNGIGAMYTAMAVDQGLLGMTFTNTAPLVSPTRAKGAALGTNPIGLGAPACDGDRFVLDIATSAVARGKIQIQARKGEPIPLGWASDSDGKPTTDANVALKALCLMPLGGTEANSGYKGTGLGIMVEILCGITSGSKYGPYVRAWTKDAKKKADLGHCFIAMNPECFAPCFRDRLSDLLNYIRKMPPVDPKKPVIVPGDWERLNMVSAKKTGGIRYLPDIIKSMWTLSQNLCVDPVKDIDGNPVMPKDEKKKCKQ